MFPPYDPYVFGRNLRMFRRWTTSTSMTQPRSAPASASAVGTRGTAFQAVWCHERCHKHDAAMLRAQLQLIMRGSSEFWRPTVMKRVKRGKRWKESVHTHTACSPRVSRREQSLNLQVFRYFHFGESCFLFYIMCRTCSASVCVCCRRSVMWGHASRANSFVAAPKLADIAQNLCEHCVMCDMMGMWSTLGFAEVCLVATRVFGPFNYFGPFELFQVRRLRASSSCGWWRAEPETQRDIPVSERFAALCPACTCRADGRHVAWLYIFLKYIYNYR